MSKRRVILISVYIFLASLAWGQAQKPPAAPPQLSEKDKKIIALFENRSLSGAAPAAAQHADGAFQPG
jgi:hypothetical protein